MNKLLVVIALLVILFGLKLYMESRYENGLDQAIALVQPAVSVDYDDLSIELDGSLSISGLQFRSAELRKPISIKNINVSSSDWLFLFRGKKAYGRGDFPESFSISVQAFEFDSRLIQLDDPENECKYIEAGIDYSSLGEPLISSDVTIELDLRDHTNGLLNLTSTNKFSTTESQMTFSLDTLRLNNQSNKEIPIETFSLSDTIDQAHAEDVIRYCANKLNLSQEEYVNTVIGSPEFTQGLAGVDLGNEFQEALKKYYQGNSTLKINAKPSDQLKNFNRARLFKNKDVIKMLNLTAELDGKTVPIEVSDMLATQGQIEEPTEIGEKITSAIKNKQEETEQDPRILERIRYEEQKKNRKPASFQLVKLTQANKFINYSVRVKRKNKADIKGRLISYDPRKGELVIGLSQYGGNVKFTINRSEVRQLEVYR